MQPLISVIIPVYNVEKYLSECLDSVIGQTYENLEIICVNDGSTDNSRSILTEYAAKNPKIKIIDQSHHGVAATRNTGMACASGEFISFVDSDDAIAPNCYETCIKYASSDVEVVAFSLTEISECGKKKVYSLPFEGKRRFAEGMLQEQLFGVALKIFRASILKKYDMTFREGFIYEDMEFSARFFLTYRPVVYYLNKPFYYYRRNSTSIMGNTDAQKEGQSIQHIYQLDSIYAFLKRHDALDTSLSDFLALCEHCFNYASHRSPSHEQAKCYWEMTSRLRKWNLPLQQGSMLQRLRDGKYYISFEDEHKPVQPPPPPSKKNLKGVERIFCVRNEGNHKVIRLFTMKIASKRRKKTR